MTGDPLSHRAVRRPCRLPGPPIISLIILSRLLKGIDTALKSPFFFRSRTKRFFQYLSQHISWEKIICQPRCVSLWHLIIDVCKPTSLRSPSIGTQSLTGALLDFFIVLFVVKPSGQPVFSGKQNRTQFHLHVTVTLCNIHHRPFFRPYSVSWSWFLFMCFDCCWMQQKTLELQTKNLSPLFFKTWIPPRPLIPLKLLGKTLQRGSSSCWTVQAAKCTKQWHWVHIMHTSSLHATATPNTDWIHSGVGRFWVSGTIPNKRGFLLMQ